jgi:nucleoside-diphosphate-sugar epimerase
MGSKMKILVTGGLGLIGHNVVKRLQDQSHTVSIIDNRTTYGMISQSELDYLMRERLKKINQSPLHLYTRNICDRESIDDIFEIEQPDVVIHMASFPRQKVVNANPAWGASVMMEGLINVLESAKKHRVKRVVYISSSMVYGDFVDDVTEDAVCRPQGQYGIMKLAGEDLVKDYTRRGCFDHVILRPSAVYGPLDVEDRVVSKFMLAAMQDRVLKVNGANETLDFTYVDDAADGIVAAAILPNAANQTFNITKSHSVSLLQAATMIVRIVGKGSIELHDKDADFPSRGALNIDRARAVLGYDPKIDVEEGFENYYVWLKNSVYWSPLTAA